MEERLDAFLDHLRLVKQASEHTIRNYSTDVLGFLTFARESGDPLDQMLVRRYLAHLQKTGHAKSSTARAIAALRAFFTYLVKHEEIESDPTQGVRPPKQSQRLPKVVREEQIETLM